MNDIKDLINYCKYKIGQVMFLLLIAVYVYAKYDLAFWFAF